MGVVLFVLNLYLFYLDTSGVWERVWRKTTAEASGCQQVSWLCLWWHLGNCQSFNESHGDCQVQREIQHPSQLYCLWARSGTDDPGGHGKDQLLWCDSVYKVSKFCLRNSGQKTAIMKTYTICIKCYLFIYLLDISNITYKHYKHITISEYFFFFLIFTYICLLHVGPWQIKMSDMIKRRRSLTNFMSISWEEY